MKGCGILLHIQLNPLMENQTMKKTFAKTVTLIMLAASLGACANMTQTQRTTAAGAVLGGVAGNLIGGDTGSTLGGAALGGVIGSQVHTRY